jgi:DNA-binding PucR family transcriptional regulator
VVRVTQAGGRPAEDGVGEGTYRLLFRVLASHPEEVRSFYDDTIAPLVRYDEQYSTELVGTLEAYLSKNCNMNATAQAIYAHRHTVAYRLERVRDLTGLDPTGNEDRERLSLGLKAHRILAPQLPR